MNRQLRLLPLLLAVTVVGLRSAASVASPISIANPSFELPTFSDGSFAFQVGQATQGSWGWLLGDGAFIYNPTANVYTGAADNGAPQGADGAQVAGIYGFGDYALFQRLVGADSVPDTADDPVFEPGKVYTLTFNVGQRALGSPATTYGGYVAQVIAGTNGGGLVIGEQTNAVMPLPGTFVTCTLTIVTPTYVHPGSIGLPISLLLRKATENSTATVEYDNVRFNVDAISPILGANFDSAGLVDAADLSVWQAHYGAVSLDARHEMGNANGDDVVDGGDFLLWQQQQGTSGPSGTIVAAEPAGGLLAMAALAGAVALRALSSTTVVGPPR